MNLPQAQQPSHEAAYRAPEQSPAELPDVVGEALACPDNRPLAADAADHIATIERQAQLRSSLRLSDDGVHRRAAPPPLHPVEQLMGSARRGLASFNGGRFGGHRDQSTPRSAA